MIAIEQYRAAIGCFHSKCVISNHPKCVVSVYELMKLVLISLMNWIHGSIDTCFGSLINFFDLLCIPFENVSTIFLYVNTIRRHLMLCITVLKLHVLVLWLL